MKFLIQNPDQNLLVGALRRVPVAPGVVSALGKVPFADARAGLAILGSVGVPLALLAVQEDTGGLGRGGRLHERAAKGSDTLAEVWNKTSP